MTSVPANRRRPAPASQKRHSVMLIPDYNYEENPDKYSSTKTPTKPSVPSCNSRIHRNNATVRNDIRASKIEGRRPQSTVFTSPHDDFDIDIIKFDDEMDFSAPNGKEDFSNTLNTAFSSYTNQMQKLKPLETPPLVTPLMNSNPAIHPLRQLVNTNTTPEKTRKELNTTPRSTKYPLKHLPLSMSPSIKSLASSRTSSSPNIPALHTHKPNFENIKPQLTKVSNAMFFTTYPSTSSTEIVGSSSMRECESENENENENDEHNTAIDYHRYPNHSSFNLAMDLLDPDLRLTNTSHLFTNPLIIPNKHRTSLHFT